mmetsp:Transcript_37640/g.85450  ORF Transcript_37640/g.85450 Transcript_37640/m.85450 type:complete len:204 (+) Transcript_37640:1548-2159(+)
MDTISLAATPRSSFTGEGGATLELCQEMSASFGVLGRRTCAHCSALLFDAESVAIPGRCEEVRGRSCCSNGDVVLLPVRELPVLRDMWRGERGDGTRLLALWLRSNGRLLEAKIISGTHRGRIVLLPPIDLTPEEGAFAISLQVEATPVPGARGIRDDCQQEPRPVAPMCRHLSRTAVLLAWPAVRGMLTCWSSQTPLVCITA